MALSNYPKRITTFPTHRDLLDDVMAEDINSLGRELTAVMSTIGANPQVYNDVNLPSEATVDSGDTGGTFDDTDAVVVATYRQYDPKITPVDHGTLGQRLDDIERGTQNHAFKLRATGIDLAQSNTALENRPKGIRFPKPGSDIDPFGYFNGTGVTLRKGGFWVFWGSVVFTMTGTGATSNDGLYQATIDFDSNYLEGLERARETGVDANPIRNPHLMGFFPRGSHITLRASQNSGRSQKIRVARLAGHLVREVL